MNLPNVRKMFTPDKGHVMLDCDLSGADAQVVAWEANDLDLMDAFKKGLKIHVKNFEDMYLQKFNPVEHKDKTQPGHIFTQYDEMKRAVHATNYAGTARTVAGTLGWKTSQAEQFQRRWLLELHPAIGGWHKRIEMELQTTRTVRNKFGYRRVYFDRVDQLLPQGLAWIPQSTIAIVTAKACIRLRKELPWVQTLMQVHDSVVLQIPFSRMNFVGLNAIRKCLEIIVPYNDPLTIPWEIAASAKSWGDCAKIDWNGKGFIP